MLILIIASILINVRGSLIVSEYSSLVQMSCILQVTSFFTRVALKW
jgi:hypothetical protein